jgi:hypothetical protein
MNRRCCTALLLLLAACSDPPELPEPPAAEQTQAILAEYESPSGTIDPDELAGTLERVRVRLDELNVSYLPELMVRLLTALRRRFDASSLPDDPTERADTGRPLITGSVEIDRVCQGWADPPGPPAAEQNGNVQITAIIEKSTLSSRLWGTATQCQEPLTPFDTTLPLPSIHAFLDGTLIIHLYGELPRSAGDADFWAGFSGTLGRDANVREVSFDFRVVERRIEFRHPVDDGNIIIGVGLTSLELRGAGASYSCELATGSCERM